MLSWGGIQRRYVVVILAFVSVFVCYIDRVNISVAIIPMAEELGWDYTTTGWVLSSFFVGYLLLQIVGGRLADRLGGKLVLGIGVVAWSVFTMLTPPAAWLGLTTLIICRIAMGMGEAVTFPAIFSLYTRWVPLGERSRSVGIANSGIPLGTVFALLVTPVIVIHLGWEWAFYLFGVVGLVWWVVWHFSATARPQEHPLISPEELQRIEEGGGQSGEQGATPWGKLLSCPAVWAIVVAHFCNNWTLYVLLSWLPTYVTKGLGVDYASVGLFSMIPHVASFLALNFFGTVADRMISGGMAVVTVRRIMQTIGFGGIACALFIVGTVETVWLAIAIMTVGNTLGAAVTGGFAVNHMDVAPKYAGTLMGITNTAGTIPGIIGVTITGMILEQTGSWALVFGVAGGIALFGLVFFLIFARGTEQVA